MNTFQYNPREYVPGVDLSTVSSTFGTLEKGHKEAVQTASQLQTAVSALDMNEAEDGFKQQLINEIDSLVKNNSTYGNAYGALDDLVLQSGKISNDQRVIGRLRAQKDFKTYEAKVDAMAIPDGMKQMYKEENPYYYQDNIDEKTGKVTSSKWEPKSQPVTTVSRVQLAQYALQFVKHKTGSGQHITFLDENGKETSDASKSPDGKMYKKTGSNYDILSAEDIKEAYNEAIKAIPGAEDSLHQDYKYELYKHSKQVTADNPTPVIPGLTNKYGQLYSFDEWNDKQINIFAERNKVYNVNSTIEYGTALESYRLRQNKAPKTDEFGNPITPPTKDKDGLGGVSSGKMEVEVNPFATASNNKKISNNSAFAILRKHGFRDDDADSISDLIAIAKHNDKRVNGPGGAAGWFIYNYGKDMTAEEKVNLVNAMQGYVAANKEYNKIVNSNTGNKDGLKFSENLNNGVFTNDNAGGKTMNEYINMLTAGDGELTVGIGKNIFDILCKDFNEDKIYNISDFAKLGLDFTEADGGYEVKLNAKNRNIIPLFLSKVNQANDSISGTFWGWAKRVFGENLDKNNVVFNHNIIGKTSAMGLDSHLPSLRDIIKYTHTNYDTYVKKAIEAEKGANFIKTGVVSTETSDARTFTEMYYRTNADALQMDEDDVKKASDNADKQVDLAFANGDWSTAKILFQGDDIDNLNADNEGGRRWTEHTNLNLEAAALMSDLFRNNTDANKYISRTADYSKSVNGTKPSYTISFTVPKDKGTDHFKEGKSYRIQVSGANFEKVDFNMSYAPAILANNQMETAYATGTAPEALGTVSGFGNTSFVLDKQKDDILYKTSAFGKHQSFNAAETELALRLLETTNQFKNQIQAGMYQDISLINQKFQYLSNAFAELYGVNTSMTDMAIRSFLKDN